MVGNFAGEMSRDKKGDRLLFYLYMVDIRALH